MLEATLKLDIRAWLRERAPEKREALWHLANQTRREHVGDNVHPRGLIEASSYCIRQCAYCGLRTRKHSLTRYRMTAEEIIECAYKAVQFGYGTVVIQTGEDPGLSQDWIAEIVRTIKRKTPLAVTLSLGERSSIAPRAPQIVETGLCGTSAHRAFQFAHAFGTDACRIPDDLHGAVFPGKPIVFVSSARLLTARRMNLGLSQGPRAGAVRGRLLFDEEFAC